MTVGTPTDLALQPIEYLLIIIQAIFFSYLGNVFSLKGIEYAPNPGYSLIISRSYVVFTAVASIYLFNAPLTTKSVVAIICIILFASLIAIDKYRDKLTSNAVWLPYTIGAFFCAGFSALSSKYLLNLGVPILTRLIYSMLLVTILIVGEIVVKNVNLKNISKPQLLTLLMIGIFGASFNYFMQVAFNLAPNVGYVNATNAASISLLTIMSYIIFRDELSIKKMIGIAGVTAGLILLFV
jgi:uncharacterized membrane protein